MTLRPIAGAPDYAPNPDFPEFTPKTSVESLLRTPIRDMVPAERAAMVTPSLAFREPPRYPEPPDPVVATVMLEGKSEPVETRRHESGAISFCFDPTKPVKVGADDVKALMDDARMGKDHMAGPVWINNALYRDDVDIHPVGSGQSHKTTPLQALLWAEALAPRSPEEKAAQLAAGREKSTKARADLLVMRTDNRGRIAADIRAFREKTSPLTRNQRFEYDHSLEKYAEESEKIKKLELETRVSPLFPEFHEWFVGNMLRRLPLDRPWETEMVAILEEQLAEEKHLRWRDELEDAIRIARTLPGQRLHDMQMIVTGLKAARG